jgi:hypothetical protein
MRKTPLAASVVVTFSVLGTACDQDPGPTQNPPPPVLEPPADTAEPAASSGEAPDTPPKDTAEPQDPRPEPEPEPKPEPVVDAGPRVQVSDNGDGTCTKYFSVDCDPGDSCNPPPPQRVPCTDDLFPKARIAKNVRKRDNGQCWEHAESNCPEGATCNPPPPQRVSCASAGLGKKGETKPAE